VAEVAFLAIGAGSHGLKLIAWLNFGFVVRMGTILSKFAFAMNELFADSISGKLVMIGNDGSGLLGVRSLIKRIIISIMVLIPLIVLIGIAGHIMALIKLI
jgi:hypothetical protein